MKKLAAAVSVILCSAGCAVYAETTTANLMSISQVELSGYIMLAGAAVALMGILFLLISLLVKVKQSAALTDEFEINEVVPEATETENTDEPADAEQAEKSEEADAAEDKAKDGTLPKDDADSSDTEEEKEPSREIPQTEDSEAELCGEEQATADETDKSDKSDELDELENSDEDKAEEPMPVKMNVRITMTGINNPDVKIIEFANEATVGRRSGNALMLSDRAVSGTHCRFTYSDGTVWLEDLNSTNGTVLNNEKIKRAELKNNDIVLLGKNKFRLKIFILN